MELRDKSKQSILDILYDMFGNHSPTRILSVCEEKQWKIESCIESLLGNDLQTSSSQGAVPKAGSRNIDPSGEIIENSPKEQKILDQIRAGLRVMVIMRGAPGSGKSHLARVLVKKSMPDTKNNDMKNFIFSTDDFFTNKRGNYNRQVRKLSEAHNDNQKKVETKAIAGYSPIIVDNTNLQIWEMMPYVQIAVKNGYAIELLEPNTPWKHSANHLAIKNSHGVPLEKIQLMLHKFEKATAEQLVKMVTPVPPPVYKSRNNQSRIAVNTQSKITNVNKPLNSDTIPLNFATLSQNKNAQNVAMQSDFHERMHSGFEVLPVPFRDITCETEASQNILESLNMSYQHNINNPISKHSTADLKKTSFAEQLSVAAPANNQPKHEYKIEKDDFVELQLNSSVLHQLNSFFASEENDDINFQTDPNEFLNVLVPRTLGNQLYKLCRQARQINIQKKKQLIDENFAKLIQNSKYSEKNNAPENLQEILDYEMALRLLNAEKNDENQENLAAYLTKLKLSGQFEEEETIQNQPETPIETNKVEKNVTYSKDNKCLALSDFEEFRNLAVHHCQLKAECYQKAKDMVQKGNNAVAGYYSQIAHFHKKKIDMYNERAANCIVEVHRLTSDSREILDLHHLHAAEAIECLDLFLDQHISNIRSSTRTYKNVFIITGRGLHSTGGVSIIKNKVKGRLKDRCFKWNEVNPGLLKVKVFSTSRFLR